MLAKFQKVLVEGRKMLAKFQKVLDALENLRLAWALTPEAWAEEKYAPLNAAFIALWKVLEGLRGRPMSQSPAEFLRALDRAATPGPWGEEVFNQFIATISTEQASIDAETMVALRTLLPMLADVAESAELKKNTHYNGRSHYVGAWIMVPRDDFLKLRESTDRLAAAVAAVVSGEGGR